MRRASPAQIKAARALLNWSQEELAEAARVSISTIRTLELGKIPRAVTLQDICKTIEHNGLEFIDGEGVRRRDFDIFSFKGEDSCDRFFEDIYKTIERYNTSVLVLSKSERILTQKCGADYRSNLNRLEELHEKTDVKCLLMDVSKPSLGKRPFPCRALQQCSCGASSCFVYGDKYAHVLTDGLLNFMVVIFSIASVAQRERKDFLSLWENAAPIA